MRLVHALLLHAAASSAIVSAELNVHDPVEDEPPCQLEQEKEGVDFASTFIAALSERVQLSGEMLKAFFGSEEPHDEIVRVVVIEDDFKEENSSLEQKRACMKALEKIHEQDQLQTETETLLQPFHPAIDMISLQVWGEVSCDDLERAELVKQCNAILDSKDTIKELLLMGQSDDEVCELMPIVLNLDKPDNLSCKLCKRFVQMVSQAMAQEVQQVQLVRAIIGDLCDAMAADSKCHLFLKNYDSIVDWLKHDTEPLVICARIAMCPSGSDSDTPSSDLLSFLFDSQIVEDKAIVVTDSRENDTSCAFCSHVAGIIYQVNGVLPKNLSMVKSVLGIVCATASSESKCVTVEANFDRIVELVQLDRLPRDVCADFDLCSLDLSYDILQPSPTVGNDKSCVYCDAATTVVEVVLQEAPDQIDQIRDYADMICGMLGDDSPCHQYVNQLDIVIDSLKKGMHPRAICKTLKYCLAEVADRISELGTSSRFETKGLNMRTEPTMVNGDGYLPHSGCFFCWRVATVIHHVNLAAPEKLPIVKTILSNLCQLLPSRYNCDSVSMNFDILVEMEKEGMHSRETCELLDICDPKQRWENAAPFIANEMKGVVVASQWPPGNATQCTYCQFATTAMRIALQQYGTDIREVRIYADMICDMLGSDNPCHVYMKEFDFVIDGITKGMSSKAICAELKFCTTQEPESSNGDVPALDIVLMVMGSMTASTDGCMLCTGVASVIAGAVGQDLSAIMLIRENANLVCGMLSSDNQCHSFVKQLDVVVESIQNGVQPKSLCNDLLFCSEGADPVKTELSVSEVMTAQNEVEESNTCAFCSGVIAVLKYALAMNPEKVKEMREAAGIMCQLLPTDDTCHADLKVFDEAMSGLQTGKGPREVCQMLKSCTSTEFSGGLMLGLPDLTGKDFLPSRCTTCRQNTLLLASLITRPDSLATFKKEIDSICRLIPESDDCELLMKHEDMIIDLLKNDKDVDAICTHIGECEPAGVVSTKAKSMSVGCLFCEYTADVLERAKNDDYVLREAKVTLETICTVLPPLARCDALTSKFDELVLLMREGKSPSEACHAIALCDSAFIYLGSSKDDPVAQAFEKSRKNLGKIMEIE